MGGLWDWLTKQNLSLWDEQAIARGVARGIAQSKAFDEQWEDRAWERAKAWREQNALMLEAARAYERSFNLINREAGEMFGGFDRTPMVRPHLLTATQRKRLFALIDNHISVGRIPYAHGARMKEYLEGVFDRSKPTGD